MSERLRLGQIPFLNSFPLHAGMVGTGTIDTVELVAAPPVPLAEMMRAGELDVAPVSLIEYLRDADRYLLLPDLAIGANGAVRSVQLAGHVPPEELSGRVVMTDLSATSQVLLQILLDELWSVDIECEVESVAFPDVLRQVEAVMLIGDVALKVDSCRPSFLNVTDLGEAWLKLTGLPMVFAVWAVRREIAQQRPDDVARLAAGLRESLDWSLQRLPEVAASAEARGAIVSLENLTRYFATLDFGLGEQARAGMMEFARRAHQRGLLTGVPEPQFFDEQVPAPAPAEPARPRRSSRRPSDGRRGQPTAPAPVSSGSGQSDRAIGRLLDHAAAGGRIAADEALLLLEAPT